MKRHRLLALTLALVLPVVLLAAAGMGSAQEQTARLLSGEITLDRGTPASEPGVVTFATWFRQGTEVAFDHELHVALEMGCTVCHHLEGCRGCHREESGDQLVSSAKVAMHGACLSCHTQAPGGGDCAICHQAGSGESGATEATGAPAGHPRPGVSAAPKLGHAAQESLMAGVSAIEPERLLAAQRPNQEDLAALEPPDEHVFITPRAGTTLVAFSHAEHADGYGLDCATCHHLERCRACHDIRAKQAEVSSVEDALHASCLGCHTETSGPTECAACHRKPTR
ncbi:MAG: cytochrome c3 family protein [Candidatus Eisenbacteria sp.]|nr:cytochrome c3 family protein [Candidatus Eisenbacteria bacterium]